MSVQIRYSSAEYRIDSVLRTGSARLYFPRLSVSHNRLFQGIIHYSLDFFNFFFGSFMTFLRIILYERYHGINHEAEMHGG
jgi:hypothetical protein